MSKERLCIICCRGLKSPLTGMKRREQGTFEARSKEKKNWGLVELEKEEKVSLYQADSLIERPGSGEKMSLDRVKKKKNKNNCPT